MGNDNTSGVNLKAYKLELVNQLLTEVFKIVESERKENGSEFAHEIATTFLASYVSTYVYRSLKYTDRLGGLYSLENYTNAKERVETAVACGFTGAHSTHEPNTSPDFLCSVRQVDDGIAKGPAS